MSFLGIDFFGLEAQKRVKELHTKNWELASDLADLICVLKQNEIEVPPRLAEWKRQYDRTMLMIQLYERCVEKAIGVGLIDPRVIDLM